MAISSQILVAVFLFQHVLCVPVAKDEIGEIKANISELWKAVAEIQAELRESFDVHTAIENHEHFVHHLGHEDTDHEIHHSERHLNHLEQVHGRTVVGPTPVEPHKPHTPEEKELLRHEHLVHHANGSHETPEEHAAHHDEAILRHLELEDGHGLHNGVHHGKEKNELAHELDVHFRGLTHEGHNSHHSEKLLKHLEEDDGHGPSLDRPKPTPAPTTRPKPVKTTLQAVCEMKPNRNIQRTKHNIQGTVSFKQPSGGPLTIQVNLKGIRSGAASLHGFHVHELVPTDEGNCNQAGAHYNPTGSNHGGRDASVRHVGDLGNLQVGSDDSIRVTLVDYVASLDGPHSILNRSLVLHEREDDLGLNPSNPESLANGGSGRRLACCVIQQL